jgi:hypothetical protein
VSGVPLTVKKVARLSVGFTTKILRKIVPISERKQGAIVSKEKYMPRSAVLKTTKK